MKRLIERVPVGLLPGPARPRLPGAAGGLTIQEPRPTWTKLSSPTARGRADRHRSRDSSALVQSPLRASLLRFLCGRPDEAFELEAMMQTFGRHAGRHRELHPRAARLRTRAAVGESPARPATPSCMPDAPVVRELMDEFLERRAAVEPRGPLAVGAALPRDDRPRREDAGRVRVDPDRGEVGHLGADPRPDRLGQGSRRADDPRTEPARHATSSRRSTRAALPDTLFESEIFGYEKGAFTGALRPQAGPPGDGQQRHAVPRRDRRHVARGAGQSCCACSRSGGSNGSAGTRRSTSNFRLISATNRPLDQLVRDERFREDLYYRVNAFAIRLPSLRERASDIPLLAQRFLSRYCAANDLPPDGKTFSREAVDLFMQLSLARQHPRAGKHRFPRGALVAGPRHPAGGRRLPARRRSARGWAARAPADPGRNRARPHRPRPRSVNWNKKRAARHTRHQPGHSLPQDRRIRAGRQPKLSRNRPR